MGLIGAAACADRAPDAAPAGSATAAVAEHEHKAPHGGVLIELGEEFAHLELVYEPGAGRMTLYVLDGEAEASVRIAQPVIDVAFAQPTPMGGRPRPFVAVTSVLTGERAGDSSQFVLEGTDYRGASALAGRVVRVVVRGAEFADVPFRWEAGR